MSYNYPVKKILCPIDVSDQSYQTADTALFLAESAGAELTFLHVVNERMFEGLRRAEGRIDVLDGIYKVAVKTMEEDRAKNMKNFLTECGAEKVPHRSLITVGVPWEEIIKIAKEENFDLIVMHARGRGSRTKMLRFGSTAERVFRRASCRTLFVRFQKKSSERKPE